MPVGDFTSMPTRPAGVVGRDDDDPVLTGADAFGDGSARGLDLGKNSIRMVRLDEDGRIVLRRPVERERLSAPMAEMTRLLQPARF